MSALVSVLAILGGTFCATVAISSIVALAFFWKIRRDATTAQGRARQQELVARLFELYASRALERDDKENAELWIREAHNARERSRREAGELLRDYRTPTAIDPNKMH